MNYLEYDFCEFQFGIYYKYLKGIKGDYYQPDDDDNIEIDKIINDIMLVINEDVIKNQYYL